MYDPRDEEGLDAAAADAADPSLEVTEEELDALKNEAEILHDQDFKAHGQSLLNENVSKAILQISKLATSASAERVRLDASKYIIERVLGPLAKLDPERDLEKDPIFKFMKASGMIQT